MTRRPRVSALLAALLLAVVPGTAPGAYAETHWKARLLSGDTTAPGVRQRYAGDAAAPGAPRRRGRGHFTADPAKVSETVHLSTHEERKLVTSSSGLSD